MKFSLRWTNNPTYNRPMSMHTFRLRDMGGLYLSPCQSVHLDQVHIVFRPTTDIADSEYQNGDSKDLPLRAETLQLMVRTDPGVRHMFYTERAIASKFAGNSDQVGITQRSTTYSSALSVCPDLDGPEDYWCRTYRPIRDLPIIDGFTGDLTDFTMELVWPLLLGDFRAKYEKIPDYRILKVYAEFSVRLS